MNIFPYTDSNKRYHTQSYALKQRFGCKVMKLSMNIGCTCPNIDGTKGVGGCTFCSGGSGHFAGSAVQSVTEQYYSQRRMMEQKWQGKFIAYFQAHTNTYCPVEKLRRAAEEALTLPDVVGIAVSTRPDCITPEFADYFADLSRRTYLTVELGLQTVNDEINARLNRCHTYADFLDSVELLHSRDINIAAHIINGLPGETSSDMLKTAEELSRLPLHEVKIHLLHVLKNTPLAADYAEGKFAVLTREEYVRIVVEQLKRFPPSFIIGRVTGDGARDELIAPLWSLKKLVVLNEIDKLMVKENVYQGTLYNI